MQLWMPRGVHALVQHTDDGDSVNGTGKENGVPTDRVLQIAIANVNRATQFLVFRQFVASIPNVVGVAVGLIDTLFLGSVIPDVVDVGGRVCDSGSFHRLTELRPFVRFERFKVEGPWRA